MVRVYVYLGYMPLPSGSGAHMRFFSNVQALLDCGADVELVEVSRRPSAYGLTPRLSQCGVTHIRVGAPRPSLSSRLDFRLGRITKRSFLYFYPKVDLLLCAVQRRAESVPNSIHWFEGEDVAAAIPFVSGARTVWSMHDIPSAVSRSVANVSSQLQHRATSTAEHRELRFVQRAERLVAERAGLVVAISDRDREVVEGWRVNVPVVTLPMSVTVPATDRNSRFDSRLHVLHLGSTSHLPGFSSASMLLADVWPLLSSYDRERIVLHIVGRSDGDDPRSEAIRRLAAPYPEVRLHGFVDELTPFYERCDLQIVAAREATGMRTRIVESFARGLPVLATPVAADGILGLDPENNILLANDPAEFASRLANIVGERGALSQLSEAGLRTYKRFHSRQVVAAEMSQLLASLAR